MIVEHGHVAKLRPEHWQEAKFRQFAGASRWVYNEALSFYQKHGTHLFSFSTILTEKKQQPDTNWLNDIHSQVLQQPLRDLNEAIKRHNKGLAKEPRFHKKGKNDSFRYPQGFKVDNNKVFLPKIGWVKFYKSKDLDNAEIRSITVRRKASGWYVSFHLKEEIPDPAFSVPTQETSVGVDLGLRTWATLSTGDKVPNPRPFRALERGIGKAQRDLERKEKGSKRWRHQKEYIARLYERAADIRKDLQHQTSNYLVNNFSLVCLETLNISAMGQSRNMGKSVYDAGLGEFVRQVTYKAKERGCLTWQADRWFPSTKTCSECGKINKIGRGDEVYICPECGLVICRDLNAALNLVAAGLAETLNGRGEACLASVSQDASL